MSWTPAIGWVVVATMTGLPGGGTSAFEMGSLSGRLEPGPHAVGFSKTLLRIAPPDESEPAARQPVELDVYRWYPAAGSATELGSMRYGDYYRVQESEPPSAASLREWLHDDMTSPGGVSEEALDRLLSSRMWAHVDAAPASGTFRLILWSYRDSIPTLQTLLCEYLASQGYIVVFAWPRDHVPPFAWAEGITDVQKLDALATQVDLLEMMLEQMKLDPGVDASRTALLAWSYGGESAQLLQRRREEVRAVIGVDATIVSGWIYQAATALDVVPREELSVPYVLIRNGQPRRGTEGSPAPGLLAEIPGSWFVRLPRLMHGNFNFPGGMIPGVLDLEEVSTWAIGGPEARLGYETICRLTAHFLNAVLGQGPTDPTWLETLPAGFVEMERP